MIHLFLSKRCYTTVHKSQLAETVILRTFGHNLGKKCINDPYSPLVPHIKSKTHGCRGKDQKFDKILKNHIIFSILTICVVEKVKKMTFLVI